MIRAVVFSCLLTLSASSGMPSWHVAREIFTGTVSTDKGRVLVQQDVQRVEKARKDGAKSVDVRPEDETPNASDDSKKKENKDRQIPFREFVPSEKIDADHAVDFPADI